MKEHIYDVIGIGLGPYNIGLAALIEEQADIEGIFFEQTPRFKWHPGMLIDGTDLQVSFLADLVTFANPRSQFTYLNYLHDKQRLFTFFFYHNFEIPRQEYDAYIKWVVEQLQDCHFGSRVIDVKLEDQLYHVYVKHNQNNIACYKGKHIVLGTGSKPNTVFDLTEFPNEDIHHSSQYLFHKDQTLKGKVITLIGSGQSASEIFLDLLKYQKQFDFKIHWYTRSPGYFQLDHSKLGQEIFSPDYVDYFHQLNLASRLNGLEKLKPLRNGVQQQTLHQIYHELYHRTIDGEDRSIKLQPLTAIKAIRAMEGKYEVTYEQWQQSQSFKELTDKLILATGYQPNIPDWFYNRFADKMVWEDDKHVKVTSDYQLIFKDQQNNRFFIQTGLEHSHGSSATNLGLTVDRNVQIINTVAGREVYQRQTGGIFTSFH
ncbi:lysine N(6)-hydroxylase/L-ornithine N(5)-oxygenase family protein [Amphibacillus cookii]|uniref:lysine N(6)-hydroxylase/L-ornithine N(5)-oxygenase family protein n=1 Tax=Amphibacillus cookii TaxID=767787 RepID=UPI00195B8545|nr:SidA/IucD/PvdA family monooxygenase [Amphibacillus cookii]MBM7540353.1 lysine N6-hydroxylase [Amphibacillus cookii]